MHLQEIILCSTSSTTGPGSISVHDILTSSLLLSFKHTNAATHCTASVATSNGQGGFILAAQLDKSILNVYNFQKDQLAMKIVVPEKLSCIAVDRSGDFCAGGTAQGRIYFWEIASGILYNSWDAHYRQVTVLRFTPDGAFLLSGSEDSAVSVWSVSRLLDDDIQSDLPVPHCTLSDHTLPVTDIIIGVGPFPTCRVLTSSVDHTVKMWDLSSRSLLTTFQFPKPIGCLAWDITERLFFAASSSSVAEGSIHQVNLFRQREDKLGNIEAVGGAGVADVIRMEEQDHRQKKRLISVGEPITSMTLSLSSSVLIVGTLSGLVNVYDTASHQFLRTISMHKGQIITQLSTMLKPPDLIGHVSLTINVSSRIDMKDVLPLKVVAPFQRMRDPKIREKHDVGMMLPVQDATFSDLSIYPADELVRDHMYFVQPTSDTQSSNSSLQSRVTTLESEITELREQLSRAKGVNDAIWENVVQKVLNGKGKEVSEVRG
jgi:pre-rRNA-processing protein IPI3